MTFHRLKIFFWTLAILLGSIQAWATRHAMNLDGVSYLDIGDAYFRGDWAHAINGYWSPFYSWILGLFLALFKPSAPWEFPVVHLANFLIYLVTLGCFEFCLEGTLRLYQQRGKLPGNHKIHLLPKWALQIWGYLLFIWTSLNLIKLELVTPDMCVAAFVFLSSGILLQIRLGNSRWGSFIGLGLVLGMGFLAKMVLLPLSFVFLTLGFFAIPDRRKALSRTLGAFLCFALVIAPFVTALSLSKGRLTFGDSPRLIYGRYAGTLSYPQGLFQDRIWPHGRKISQVAVIYELGTDSIGTFPPTYDPSTWWGEGVVVRFNARKQMGALLRNIRLYGTQVFKDMAGFLLVLTTLSYLGGRKRQFLKELTRQWILLIPSIFTLGMYSLVLVEPRYVGAFVTLLLLALFCGIVFERPPDQWNRPLKGLMLGLSLWAIGLMSLGNARENSLARADFHTAEALTRLGVHPGDKVACIGKPPTGLYWARLARVQIVCYLRPPGTDGYWTVEPSIQAQTNALLASRGIKAIVAEINPACVAPPGRWNKLGQTDWHAVLLSED